MSKLDRPILRVRATEADREALSVVKTVRGEPAPEPDYTSVVVNKPWGYEYLMFQNRAVAVWILFLEEGAQTSMHCHVRKKTSLIVLEGEVVTYSLDDRSPRKAMSGVIIDAAVFHSTRAISPGGAFVMEIESPPDKQDLVRLRDEYGRQGAGYEGTQHHSKDFSSYEYVAFHGSGDSIRRHSFRRLELSLTRCEPGGLEPRPGRPSGMALRCSFGPATVLDDRGGIVLAPGDVCDQDHFARNAHRIEGGVLELFTITTLEEV